MINPIAIPMEDPIIHTEASPWCQDPSCPCQAERDTQDVLCEMDEQAYYSRSEQLADEATAAYYDEMGTHDPLRCRCPWCSSEE